jgi:hypothetical protein
MRVVNDERGSVAVIVALLMVVLIGFAALAIDVASLYQERRTLQNGADAGALAVAKDCAGTGCGGFAATADTYADLNADDGDSNVDEVCGTGAGLPACADPPTVPSGTEYVQVTTSTYEVSSPGNPTEVNFNFAPVFDLVAPGDHVGKTMQATAVAAWGHPGGAATLPLTFSLCEYRRLVPTPADLEPPYTDSLVHFHGAGSPAGSCPAGPSGADLPGGFGWLDAGSDCEAQITVGDWVDDKPGASKPSCLDLVPLQNTTVLLPVYNDTNGLTGSNGEYRIVGFAAFHITGYRFPGNVFPAGLRCPPSPGTSGSCLRGYFTGFTTTGTVFGGPDMGVTIIKIVG